MFENVFGFLKKIGRKDRLEEKSKDTAKERLHLVLMQDRANVSADFLDMMRQEIIEVIKKYIDVDERDIDVRLTNKTNEDGTTGAPALYANIPIAGIKENVRQMEKSEETNATTQENSDKENEKTIKNEKQEEVQEEKIEQEESIENENQTVEETLIDENEESKEVVNENPEKPKEKIKSNKQ